MTRLPDENFLGAIMAVASFGPFDLIQNIIASKQGDFTKYGVFTARFYVEGDWVEVITDTRLPSVRNPRSGVTIPLYGRCSGPNEFWIPLVEKAYAKALGTYEAIPKVKIQDVLVHLTGGSVQVYQLNEHYAAGTAVYKEMWEKLKHYIQNDSVILAMPSKEKDGREKGTEDLEADGSAAIVDSDEVELNVGILQDRLYSIAAFREIGIIELLMLRDPWGLQHFEGEWNENSPKWDDYPDILESIYEDPTIHWRREAPNGYIWMSYKEFVVLFKDLYFCKLFPDEKFNYYFCRGEWAGLTAGGPKHIVGANKEEVVRQAKESELIAFQRATAAVVIDSDASWFNNPQFMLQAHKSTLVYISVTPVGDPLKLPHVNVDIVSVPKSSSLSHLWDFTGCEQVTIDEGECPNVRTKGQESAIWQLKLDARNKYFIVPFTVRRGTPGTDR